MADLQTSMGGGGLRGLGSFFLALGIIGIIVWIVVYSEAIAFPVGYMVLIVGLLIVGFILEGFYIIPEWIRVPVLQLGTL